MEEAVRRNNEYLQVYTRPACLDMAMCDNDDLEGHDSEIDAVATAELDLLVKNL